MPHRQFDDRRIGLSAIMSTSSATGSNLSWLGISKVGLSEVISPLGIDSTLDGLPANQKLSIMACPS